MALYRNLNWGSYALQRSQLKAKSKMNDTLIKDGEVNLEAIDEQYKQVEKKNEIMEESENANLYPVMELIQHHHRKVHAKYQNEYDMISGLLVDLKDDTLNIKSMIGDLTLKLNSTDDNKEKYDQILDLLFKEMASRHKYLDQLEDTKNKIEVKTENSKKYIQEYINDFYKIIDEEFTENVEQGKPIASETLNGMRKYIAGLQNQMHKYKELVNTEQSRRQNIDPLFTTIALAPIKQENLDEISKIREVDINDEKINMVEGEKFGGIEQNLTNLMKDLDRLEGRFSKGIIEKQQQKDMNYNIGSEDIFKLEFEKFQSKLMSELEKIKPVILSKHVHEEEMGNIIKKINEEKDEGKGKENQTHVEILNSEDMNIKHQREQNIFNRELEKEKNEYLKVLDNAAKKQDFEEEKVVNKYEDQELIQEMDGLSKKIAKRMWEEQEKDRDKLKNSKSIERQKQDALIQKKIKQRQFRKQKLMERKQQEEKKALKLKEIQEEQNKLHENQNVIEVKFIEITEKETDEILINQAVIDALKDKNNTLKQQLENYNMNLATNQVEIQNKYENKLKEKIEEIQKKYKEEEMKLKVQLKLKNKKNKESSEDEEHEQLLIKKHIENKLQQEINKIQDEVTNEYQEEIGQLHDENEKRNARLLNAVNAEKELQREKLKEVLEGRKKATLRKAQRKQQAEYEKLKDKQNEELQQVKENIEKIESEQQFEDETFKADDPAISLKENEELIRLKQDKIEEMKKKHEAELRKEKERIEKELKDHSHEDLKQIQQELTNQMENYDSHLLKNKEIQDQRLKERLEAKKARQLLVLKRKQESEIAQLNNQINLEIEERLRPRKLEKEKEAVEQLMRQGKISEQKVSEAVNKILKKRQEEEMQNLFAKQYNERIDAIKLALGSFYEEKAKARLVLVQKLKKQKLSEDEMESRITEFEKEYLDKQMSIEITANFNIQQEHEKQITELNRRQMTEKLNLYHTLLPEDLYQKAVEDSNRQISEMAASIDMDAKKQIENIQDQINRQKEDLEAELQKERENTEKKHKEQLEKVIEGVNKKMDGLKEAFLKEQEELKRKQMDDLEKNDEKTKEMLQKELDEDLLRFEAHFAQEKERQIKLLDTKLQIRKNKKLKIRERKIQVEQYEKNLKLKKEMAIKEQMKEQEEKMAKELKNLEVVQNVASKLHRKIEKRRNEEKLRKEKERLEEERLKAELEAKELEKEIQQRTLKRENLEIEISPEMVEKINNIEKKLNTISALYKIDTTTKAMNSQYYLDLSDDQYKLEGKLSIIPYSSLNEEVKDRIKFAYHFMEVLEWGFESRITIEIANTLLHNTYKSNTYKNSCYYDHGLKKLYLRKDRAMSDGDFMLLICHCLAHIKINPLDLSNDNEIIFTSLFFKYIKIYEQELFKKREVLKHYKEQIDLSGIQFDFKKYGTGKTNSTDENLISKIRVYAPQQKWNKIIDMISKDDENEIKVDNGSDEIIENQLLLINQQKRELMENIENEISRESSRIAEIRAEITNTVFIYYNPIE